MHHPEPASTTVHRRGSASVGGDPTRTVVCVNGDHDAATQATLILTLSDAWRLGGGGDLVVDLSCIRFMDASTVGALIAVRKRLRATACELTVRNPSPSARRLLEHFDLEAMIDPPTQIDHPVGAAAALSTWVTVSPAEPSLDPAAELPAEQPTLSAGTPRAAGP